MHVHRCALTAASLTAVAALSLSACSTTSGGASDRLNESPAPVASTATTPDASSSAVPTPGVPVPAGLVGNGCAGYAEQVPAGPGSLNGMGRDPVAVALSNSPQLTTLTGALSGKLNPDVSLGDTLNSGQFTVFAPTDNAFGRLDPATVEKLKTDAALLTSVLNYHVVANQADPTQIAGEHKTVQGAPLTVSGSDNDLKVNNANVVCGGIKTANATVYLIDTVLMPPPPAPAAPTSGATTGETSGSATPTPTPTS